MWIRIITDDPAWGKVGDEKDVSPVRAARWVEKGIAEYIAREATNEPEVEAEPTPEPRAPRRRATRRPRRKGGK